MRTFLVHLLHLVTGVAKLLGPGGARAVIGESLVVKHQLLILNRSRRRAPNLSTLDRMLLGFWSLFLSPGRIDRVAVIIRPATLQRFHEALKKRKYGRLFSSCVKRKPGPKGPSQALIQAIVEMKRRNPRFGCPMIAQQISKAFGIEINKDVVRRVLAMHYQPQPNDCGPSWLTFIGHMKDSLWSVDLFRCESITLKTHWVLVVMGQFTRRIIGFGVHRDNVDGVALCRMFNRAISRMGKPKYLSTDLDPLFEFHRWKANLSILDVDEIKSVPNVPFSHPFVERLIGSLRREYLDQFFFWNTVDLERKLTSFQQYYNNSRTHTSLDGNTPAEISGDRVAHTIMLDNFTLEKHCGGLFELPMAA